MHKECFADNDVARVLEANCVSVKVDREERPDVDHLYMSACLALNGQGGWPLTVLCTPDRKPFFARTYYPKWEFIKLIEDAGRLFSSDPKMLLSNSAQITMHLRDVRLPRAIPDDAVQRAAKSLLTRFDKRYGGFLPAPKFPSPHNLMFLLRYGIASRDTCAYTAVFKTLTGMLCGGLKDHVGGGFFRYSTDAKWRVPHYEKMCYDQALIMMALTEGSQLGGGAYSEAVRELYVFAMENLASGDGGFYTALDADSTDGEGMFYLWTKKQAQGVLGEDAVSFFKLYAFGDEPALPYLKAQLSRDDMMLANKCLSLLKGARSEREKPFRDEKLLLTNNALMAAALAKAGAALGENEYTLSAGNALRFIERTLIDNGRLLEVSSGGAHPATLDGYAYYIWALIELYGATFDPRCLKSAVEWNQKLLGLFDDGRGGLYYTGSDVKDLPVRQHNAFDGALPSGVSVHAMNLLRHSRLCGEPEWATRAQRLMESVSNEVNAVPDGYTALLSARLFQGEEGTDVVLTSGPSLEAMQRALAGYRPFMQVTLCGEGYEMMSSIAPFTRDMKTPGCAYVCAGHVCSAPVTTPEALAEALGPAGHSY